MSKNHARLSLVEFFCGNFTPIDVVEVTSCGDAPGPALCSHGCVVGLHDRCRHGCPSVLVTMMQYGYGFPERTSRSNEHVAAKSSLKDSLR
jgi:hypothetical protein